MSAIFSVSVSPVARPLCFPAAVEFSCITLSTCSTAARPLSVGEGAVMASATRARTRTEARRRAACSMPQLCRSTRSRRRRSMRETARAPVLVEKEKPVAHVELIQGERRALSRISIDPIGDCEFRGDLPCDALDHGYTRTPGCCEAHAVGRGLPFALTAASVITVEAAGKAMILITARNTGRPDAWSAPRAT